MTRTGKVLTCALCAILLVETGMAAQWFRRVPGFSPYVGRDPVEFTINLLTEYTDNRDATETEEDDTFDTSLQPRVDLFFQGEQSLLDVFLTSSLRHRSNPSDIQNETEWYHDFGLQVEHTPAPRLKLTLKEKLNITDNPSVEEADTTLRRDSSFTLNRAEAGANWQTTRNSEIGFTGRHMVRCYDEDTVASESDKEGADAGITFRRHLTRTLSVLGLANVSSFEYGGSEGIERDFSSASGGFGIDSLFSTYLLASVQGGWTTLDYKDRSLGTDGDGSEEAPFVRLRIRGTASPSLRITGGVSYLLRDSDVYPYASQKYTSLFTGVQWEPVPNLTLGLSGTYRVGDYDQDALPSNSDTDYTVSTVGGEETIVIATAEAGYQITPDTSMKLVHRCEDVDSDVSTSFTRNSATLMFSIHF